MGKAREAINLMIGGEAGQGLVTIGQALAKALVRAGYHIVVSQSYHSRIRGGHNTYTIRAGVNPLASPTEGVDILVALNQETLDLHQEELNPGAQVVADSGLTCGEAPCFNVPYKDLAEGRYLNTVALGVASHLLGLDPELVEKALQKLLGKKLNQEALDKNHDAMAKALAHAKAHDPDFGGLAPAAGGEGRLMLNGNEAIGLGALAGGLKFVSFYPMTPSTSIALTVIAHADAMGVVVEQAEDEIAAINMAIGASYAGAPAMVTTSGGGFALMCEGISLAAMTETPVLVALSQRPGPATGLPTRTEQGDLEMVLHAGHGDFARAVFTPGSVEESFYIAARALAQAEKFQTPVLLLTDQFMADSYRGVEPFDLEKITPVQAGVEASGDYVRYAVTDSGISPRALPGMSEQLVVADSDEHTPDGHITEDLTVRVTMQDKRMAKLAGLTAEALPPIFDGPQEADLLLVGWGTSQGAIAEAAQNLGQEGKSVATCHFPQVWPLRPDTFLERFAQAGQVVVVEGNAVGQFARLLRRETGFKAHRLVLRYDGLPFTPQYIQRELARQSEVN